MRTRRHHDPHSIDVDALWPRDDEHRYRIYARRGDKLEVLAAAPDPASVGVALVQLHEDEKERGRRLADRGMIGVLDVLADGPRGEWILLPWPKREVRVTLGPLPIPIEH